MIFQEENSTNGGLLGTRGTRPYEAGLSVVLSDRVAGNDARLVEEWRRWFFALPPSEEPDEWAEVNMFFDEQEVKGRCDFTGRNFLRRPIRDNNNPEMREQTLVFGRGCGKTLTQIIGISWKILFAGSRGLMVFPVTNGEGGSGNFVSTRLIPDIEATPVLSALLPKGQQRFDVNKKHVTLNGAHFGFVGSNSAGQVVGNRLSDIRMDELEKFKMKLGNEAGTAKLIKGSTEGVKEFQVFNTSTPSIDSGLIWQSLAKSNFMLCFVPCPHCQRDAGPSLGKTEEERQARAIANGFKGWFVYAWNEQFAMGLPGKFAYAVNGIENLEIPMGFVRWPKSCEGRDGVWDLDGVKRGAFVECPHCKGAIRDAVVTPDGRFKAAPEIKIWMDANHFWMGTQPGEPRHLGYQLSSLYAPVMNEESTWGGRASKFLSAVAESPEAVNDFINSILGLAAVGQAHDKGSLEVVPESAPAAAPNWVTMLSADVQQNWPYFWFVVRRWLAWVLRPPLTPEERAGLIKSLPQAERDLCAKVAGNLVVPEKDENLYSPLRILAEVQRFEGWRPLAAWLAGNGLTGVRLTEFFQAEFQGDSLRLVEWVCKQAKVAIGRQGDSEAVHIGHVDDFRDLDDLQREHKIFGTDMIVDSGWGARDNAEVYAECFLRAMKFCFYQPLSKRFTAGDFPGSLPFALDGWVPSKGFPIDKRWRDAQRIAQPYEMHVDDPFKGKAEAHRYFHWVFHFSKQHFLEEIARVREKRRNIWGVGQNCIVTGNEMNNSLEQYRKHLAGKWKDKDGKWQERKLDHLFDCENMQMAYATYKGIFNYQPLSGGNRGKPLSGDNNPTKT